MPEIKDSKKKIKITKDANLGEVLFKYPQTAEVFLDYGMHCVGCIASSFDTIEEGAKIHQIKDQDIDEMMERVNEVIETEE